MAPNGGRFAVLGTATPPHATRSTNTTNNTDLAGYSDNADPASIINPANSSSTAVISEDDYMEDECEVSLVLYKPTSTLPTTSTPRQGTTQIRPVTPPPPPTFEPSKRKRTEFESPQRLSQPQKTPVPFHAPAPAPATAPIPAPATGSAPVQAPGPAPDPAHRAIPRPAPTPLKNRDTNTADITYEYLHSALSSMKMAHEAQPYYRHIIRAIEVAIREVENPRIPQTLKETATTATTTQTPKKGLQESTWATVAAKGKKPAGPTPAPPKTAPDTTQKNAQKDPGPFIKGPIQIPGRKTPANPTATSTPTATKTTQKPNPNSGRKLIVKRRKEDGPVPLFNPLSLRNEINKILGTPAVLSIETTDRDNFAITTLPTYSAKQLLEKQELWGNLFNRLGGYAAEEPTQWVKLVANKVPIFPDLDTLSIFKDEAKTFNNIDILGEPRWIGQRREGQRAGSVVFAVKDATEKARILKQGYLHRRRPRPRPCL